MTNLSDIDDALYEASLMVASPHEMLAAIVKERDELRRERDSNRETALLACLIAEERMARHFCCGVVPDGEGGGLCERCRPWAVEYARDKHEDNDFVGGERETAEWCLEQATKIVEGK